MITDAQVAAGDYVDILVTQPVAAEVARLKANNPFGQPSATIKIDSSSIRAFASGRTGSGLAEMFQLVAVAPAPENQRDADSVARNFIVKVADPRSNQV